MSNTPEDYEKKDSFFLATLYQSYETNATRILRELKKRGDLRLLKRND